MPLCRMEVWSAYRRYMRDAAVLSPPPLLVSFRLQRHESEHQNGLQTSAESENSFFVFLWIQEKEIHLLECRKTHFNFPVVPLSLYCKFLWLFCSDIIYKFYHNCPGWLDIKHQVTYLLLWILCICCCFIKVLILQSSPLCPPPQLPSPTLSLHLPPVLLKIVDFGATSVLCVQDEQLMCCNFICMKFRMITINLYFVLFVCGAASTCMLTGMKMWTKMTSWVWSRKW